MSINNIHDVIDHGTAAKLNSWLSQEDGGWSPNNIDEVNGISLLMRAIIRNKYDMVKLLIEEYHADVNVTITGKCRS